jgi:hypothetical protein
VLRKLATAGFAINANKCSFCKPQIKFLGHVISSEILLSDADRIKVILSYPPPRNQKQLGRFFGICNFHRQFFPELRTFHFTIANFNEKWAEVEMDQRLTEGM